MARPIKEGLDYFPMDCQLDEKLELIEAEFGLTGFGVVVKLLQKIFGQRGYYIEWTYEVALLFAKNLGLGGSVVSEIINASVKRNIFSKELFDKYNILTSVEIQQIYIEATSRRQKVEMKKEYLLVDVPKNRIMYTETPINVNINSRNADNNPQSKVKESKVNKRESREKKTPTPDDHNNNASKKQKAASKSYGEFNNVLLTDEELTKLKERFADYEDRIQRLSMYIESSGRKYKSHYAVILTWARDDEKKQAKGSIRSYQAKADSKKPVERTYDSVELERRLLRRS